MNTTTETEDARLVKVGFRDAAGDVETLWAFDLGDGRYRLDSTPWFQYGVSYQDVVEASPEADGMLFFSRVVEKSGRCTVRVQADDGVSSELIERLVAIGCTYEGASPKYIAFDVPVRVGLDAVVAVLVEANANWEHADPTYEQLQPDGA
jgi:hypothetical protein